MDDKLNFCIGYVFNGQINCYAFGSEVHYGDLKSAKSALEYVKEIRPDKDWRVFTVEEIKEA